MPLYFITGNKNKFEEIKSVLPEILRAPWPDKSFLPAATRVSAGIRFSSPTDITKHSPKWTAKNANPLKCAE